MLLVFYLGFGCAHCIEQLKAFSPVAADFKAAGIDIVAIGTDTVQDLLDSATATTVEISSAGVKKTRDEPYAFPLLSDSELEVFRRFRAYDDFEKQPLHGLFLVDSTGRLRWQDINYEPFTDAAFVLKEAKRLLSQGQLRRPPIGRQTANRSEGNGSHAHFFSCGHVGTPRHAPAANRFQK